ncbi:hypothetical protein B0T14DRAFT_565588 [Immersiella caudata]|uniref:Amidase domain-containing protein n=1 Tax=Immersiella caudata TaxID=314043 RepID=A0AA40C4R6_9PEZI|nr:hypothetical protein B0T14DRAFT_565588 [Immersiella caudata]
MEKAVKDLERYLDAERREIDLAEKWETENPSGTGEPIAEYLQDTFMTFLLQGYYKNFLSFRRDYEKEFGTPPQVHPAVYSKWLRESILDSDFNVVMVHPVGDFDPFYRDVYRLDPKDRSQAYDWDQREDHQASLAGVPSIVVPVGQVSQPSKIMAQGQVLPVTISLMSGTGTDFQLTGMIQDMAQTGFLAGSVKVGSHAF